MLAMCVMQPAIYKSFVHGVDLNIPRLAGDKEIDFSVTPDYAGLHKNYQTTIALAMWNDGKLTISNNMQGKFSLILTVVYRGWTSKPFALVCQFFDTSLFLTTEEGYQRLRTILRRIEEEDDLKYDGQTMVNVKRRDLDNLSRLLKYPEIYDLLR
jgi:hypothetical protein